MSVVFPKLPDGERWFVTKPYTDSLGTFGGKLKRQRQFLGVWYTIASSWYFPSTTTGSPDYSLNLAIKRLMPEHHDDADKYVGPH